MGSANLGWRLAVTLIEREVFHRIRGELDPSVTPGMRRAGLMIASLPLDGSRGRLLAIVPVRLRIGGETRPCEMMDEEGFPGIRRLTREPPISRSDNN